jgi:hypothetical protein
MHQSNDTKSSGTASSQLQNMSEEDVDRFLDEYESDEIPEHVRLLWPGSNFLMGPEREQRGRIRPMGDPEELHTKILDAAADAA